MGIAGTGVRAGMLKVVTDRSGITPDVRRVMEAAATAHLRTGVPITTHTHAPSRNGRDQLAFFRERGVAPERLVIGHCGDTEDLDYLRELMDAGATIGMDRFGMEHVLPDDVRGRDRAQPCCARGTPTGWSSPTTRRTSAASRHRRGVRRHAPHWNLENISRRILPAAA